MIACQAFLSSLGQFAFIRVISGFFASRASYPKRSQIDPICALASSGRVNPSWTEMVRRISTMEIGVAAF
jgi:hypothetical protein